MSDSAELFAKSVAQDIQQNVDKAFNDPNNQEALEALQHDAGLLAPKLNSRSGADETANFRADVRNELDKLPMIGATSTPIDIKEWGTIVAINPYVHIGKTNDGFPMYQSRELVAKPGTIGVFDLGSPWDGMLKQSK